MTFVADCLKEAEITPSKSLRDVPEDEWTEGSCRAIFYPHLDDEDWEDLLYYLLPGEIEKSDVYGVLIYRDKAGNLHFPVFG